MSAWAHLRAIALLPGTVTVAVPGLILYLGDSARPGWALDRPLAVAMVALGAVLVASGIALWAWTVALFARVGQGTLAPWDPTRRLVVEGPYRHARNPMITGVLAVLLGEAALLGSPPLLVWALAFFSVNAIWFPLAEEPGLERRFGHDYVAYKRNVPRWLPRLRPWDPAR
jgi:protein-S-isoprenylcysteine O-methyltransferase Ste14